MAGIKLFGTKDRAESHAVLEQVLAVGEHPRASCREDANDPNEPYQVWSDTPDPFTREPEPVAPAEAPALAALDDAALNKLADILLAKMGAAAKGG